MGMDDFRQIIWTEGLHIHISDLLWEEIRTAKITLVYPLTPSHLQERSVLGAPPNGELPSLVIVMIPYIHTALYVWMAPLWPVLTGSSQ